MKKSLFALILILLVFTSSAYAEEISIIIDGEKVDGEDKPLLIQGRTLVPVRMVMEHIGADVNWISKEQKVSVRRGPQEIILKVGTDNGKVNGVTYSLDTSVQIIEGRTYIPLRFVGESLGADVEWLAKDKSVSIQMKKKIPNEILGYYVDYNSYISFNNNLDIVTGILPMSYGINKQGEIITNVDFPTGRQFAKENGKLVMGVIFADDSNVLSEVLNNQQKRNNLIDNIEKLIIEKGYDGINIDFERVRNNDKEVFESFIGQLYERLQGNNLLLAVCVPAYTGIEYWYDAYDYKYLGANSDKLIIMAYDEHYLGGTPGPIASLGWVERILKYAVNEVDSEKLILGIGIYGYEWPSEGAGRTIDVYTALKQSEEYGAIPVFHEEKYVPFYIINNDQGQKQVWFEDQRSIMSKIELSHKYSLGGVALWRLGIITEDIWEAIRGR